MKIDTIPEFIGVAKKLKNIESDLYVNIDRNYREDTFRLVFSSANQKYRESFEKIAKKKNMATGGTAIINYSYLDKLDYPTIGLEIFGPDSNFPADEDDINQIVNLIKDSIDDYNKKRK